VKTYIDEDEIVQEIVGVMDQKIQEYIERCRSEIVNEELPICVFDGYVLDMNARIMAGIIIRIRKECRKEILDQFIHSVYNCEEFKLELQALCRSNGG